MTRIAVPQEVRELLLRLRAAGFAAYAVGGCVRDSLRGEAPQDWDICTSAKPQETAACFASERVILTGERFGTVTVLRGGQGYEITTFRAESGYSDSRHPDAVAFLPELRGDLLRRDFTVNAMAADAEGRVIDLFGGRDDLAAGVIRCVGRSAERFSEDALRMLRACRFAAQLGFAIEPETWAALLRCAPLCKQLSRERITEEVTKTIRSPSPQWAAAMIRCGLLTSCCLTGSNDLSQLSVLPPTAEARWAGFGLLVPELDFSAFRLPAKLVKLCRMVRAHWPAPEERLGWKRLLAAEGEEAARLLATLAQTDAVDEIIASGDCVSLKTLAVSGRDFPLLRGPALGQLLNRLLEHVLQAPADNNRETLLELSKKFESPS